MGREVYRVPLDFGWELGRPWEGYLRPARFREAPCPAGESCLNGTTTARAWVEQITDLLLMLDDDRRRQREQRPMHPYLASVPQPPRPSRDIAEFGAGLAGRAGGVFGHDAVDRWRAVDAVIRAAGLDPDTWGICPGCGGHGSVEAYPGQRADAEAWEPTGPPAGEGWQLWETVSEGSPISPVFPTAEELAQWLTTPAACWGAMREPMTIEQAREFVQATWAPAGIGGVGAGRLAGTYLKAAGDGRKD